MSIIKLSPYILDSTLDFTFNNVTSTGNLLSVNANLGNAAVANYFIGNGSLLSSITGSNVTGQVANASVAGTVYTAAQPNITSVGTLTDLSVSGNAVISGNLTVNGTVTSINSTTVEIDDLAIVIANDASTSSQANGAGIIINGANANILYIDSTNSFTFSHKISADGGLLSNITGANVSGEVAHAAVANSVAVANVVGIGNIATINKDGNASNILYGNGVFAAAPTGGTGGGASILDDLTDVTITSPANNQVLSYDSANSIWKNKTISTGGGASVTVSTTPPASPAEGDMWLDDESGELNVYFGGAWGSVTESAPQFISVVNSFTGDATTTQFELTTTPASEDYTILSIGGILQPHNTYSISGNVLTTSSAAPLNTPIEITILGGAATAPAQSPTNAVTASKAIAMAIVFGF